LKNTFSQQQQKDSMEDTRMHGTYVCRLRWMSGTKANKNVSITDPLLASSGSIPQIVCAPCQIIGGSISFQPGSLDNHHTIFFYYLIGTRVEALLITGATAIDGKHAIEINFVFDLACSALYQ
jgi:hypothetical protein